MSGLGRDETAVPLEFGGKSWFKDPLCHDHCCSKSPMWENAPGAMVLGTPSSDVVLYATLMNEVISNPFTVRSYFPILNSNS